MVMLLKNLNHSLFVRNCNKYIFLFYAVFTWIDVVHKKGLLEIVLEILDLKSSGFM